MNKKVIVSGVAAVLSLAVSAAAKKPYVEGGIALKETEARTYESANGKVFRYRWHEPKDVRPDARYPLVVLMHGAGERGDDNERQLTLGANGIFSCFRQLGNVRGGGYETPGSDFYLVAGQVPKGKQWVDTPWADKTHAFSAKPSETMGLQIEFLEKLLAKTPMIDRRRVYAVGMSMGGYGTWDLIARKPEWFAAALPMCGGGDPATAKDIRDVAIWAYHTSTDGVVPVCNSRNMIKALWDCEAPHVRYTELHEWKECPNSPHFCWGAAMGDTGDFRPLDWVLSRRRPVGERKTAYLPWPKMDTSLFAEDLSNAVLKPGSWTTRVTKNPSMEVVAQGGETLFTKDVYENFELDCWYRLGKGGRGGILIYVGENPEDALEIRLADDDDPALNAFPNAVSGSLYGRAEPKFGGTAHPAGVPWYGNRVIVRAEGKRITVFHNDVEVQDVNLDDFKSSSVNPDGSPVLAELKGRPALSTIPTRGRIGFRGKFGKADMFYRWISIRPLKSK